ncbi:ROK family protein [Oerskovia jenensis]|uniref:ROK family protein n=1 Tax=Oerskovia jenensis TaxID=162169 RepID=UPI0036DD4259
MAPPVLGLDIGGTKLAVGMVGEDGRVDRLLIEPTRREEGARRVLERLFAMGREVVDAAGLGAPTAVGISCGGPLDATTGVLLNPPHLPGWIDVPVVAMAAEVFDVPVFLENDATAAALGEYMFGAGTGTSTLVYLTVSTGVGGGAVIDGRLHRGAAGNGGELGHITVRPEGRSCTCGRRGCLEAYCSGTQIARRAEEAVDVAVRTGRPTTLADVPAMTAADVSRAAAAGDQVAREVWDETTALLGQGVTDLVNVFEPDVVVLGGGVTRAGSMLLDPVREIVRHQAMGPAARAARVVLAGLGDAVGVVGAGAVALDALREQDHCGALVPATSYPA